LSAMIIEERIDSHKKKKNKLNIKN